MMFRGWALGTLYKITVQKWSGDGSYCCALEDSDASPTHCTGSWRHHGPEALALLHPALALRGLPMAPASLRCRKATQWRSRLTPSTRSFSHIS